MLSRLGIKSRITSRIHEIEDAERVILPGNGSFDACMHNLRGSGLIPTLENLILNRKIPLLGICVGAQMLGKTSAEGRELGLGWLEMKVERLPSKPGLRVPHMGWNSVEPFNKSHFFAKHIDVNTRFYFIHSYYMVPDNISDVLFESFYDIRFCSAVVRKNIVGVQFHPEKSHRFGKEILTAFVKWQP
jgi:glutamine amidotransferase